MKQLVRTSLVAALGLVVALPLAAGRPVEDALALVPADSASVGVIRLADLRSNPLSARLFQETDRLTIDGDAARFLDEARLAPREDVDVIVVAGSPKSAEKSATALVIFEGRFDPSRLGPAIATRGAIEKSGPQGIYYLLADKGQAAEAGRSKGAVAFVSDHMILAGDESAVLRAMAQRVAGGTGFTSGTGIGRHLSLVDSGASAWALVDMTKMPKVSAKVNVEVNGNPLAGVMKSMSVVAVQATVKGDALKLAAQGLSADEETLELLEDSIKGIFAAWRLAIQEKSPEMVSVIRKFKVERDATSVSVSGTLPGAAVRAMAEKMTHHRDNGAGNGTTGK